MPMTQNKDLDSRLNDKLQQHYAVKPHPDFLSELKNDVLDHFNGQRQAKTRRYKFAFASIAVVLVLVIVLFATPLGSALAQEFVELFSRAESNVMPNYPGQTAIARDATLAAAPTLTPGPKYTLTPTPTITPGPGDKKSNKSPVLMSWRQPTCPGQSNSMVLPTTRKLISFTCSTMGE
jgi:hypothetical protein